MLLLNIFSFKRAGNYAGIWIVMLLLTSLCFLNGCSKNTVRSDNPASILVFNASSDMSAIYVVPSHNRPIRFTSTRSILNNYFDLKLNRITITNEQQPIMLFAFPDTLDKDEPVVKSNIDLEKGAIYSMFLYGNRASAQYLFHKDDIPRISEGDSIMLIRFANFSEEQAVSVNIRDNPSGSFIQQVDRHSLSAFQSLPVLKSVSQHELEIRDAASGELLLTYPLTNINEFRTNLNPNFWVWFRIPFTFVLTGQRNGTGATALKVTKMNHR